MSIDTLHQIHGFGTFAFDDYRIPAAIWKRTTLCVETGCWEYVPTKRRVSAKIIVVKRLLGIEWRDLYRADATCANDWCINPAHLCVILRNK